MENATFIYSLLMSVKYGPVAGPVWNVARFSILTSCAGCQVYQKKLADRNRFVQFNRVYSNWYFFFYISLRPRTKLRFYHQSVSFLKVGVGGGSKSPPSPSPCAVPGSRAQFVNIHGRTSFSTEKSPSDTNPGDTGKPTQD